MKEFTNAGLILRGMAMGIAEVIPGVSGGTIAFITGIYKTLIDSIKAIDLSLFSSLLKFRIGEVWEKLNGTFLMWLIAGMIGGILVGVFGVTYLLETYPEVLWGFFFGLILASIPYMLSQLNARGGSVVLFFILGAIVAYGITKLTPSQGSLSYTYVYIAGAIAISALVLPGISGSFMLLIMGLYTTIIPTIKAFLSSPELSEFALLFVFGLGCLTGLAVFSRIIAAAFEKYYNPTIALLSGFMLGSLNKIWPWRNPSQLLDKDSGNFISVNSGNVKSYDLKSESIKIVQEANVLPADYFYDGRLPIVIAAFVLGLVSVFLMSRFKTDKA